MHPYLFDIPTPWGPHPIPTYGFLIMCGFLAALYVLRRRSPRFGVDPMAMFDLCVALLFAGIIGARLSYVIWYWREFADEPWAIVKIARGGLIFYGGLIAGIVAFFAMVGRRGMPRLTTLDLLACVMPLAHAFGRLGCFIYGCCYGGRTDAWFGVRFPAGSPAFHDHYRGVADVVAKWSHAVHPTQLYAVAYNLVIFGVLGVVLARRRRAGDVAWTYLILYGTARFVNELFRDDMASSILGLTLAQAICVPAVVVGVVMLTRSLRRPPEPMPEPWTPPEEEEEKDGEQPPQEDAAQKRQRGGRRRRR